VPHPPVELPARERHADYLRQPELSLVDIAFLLGYQEQSAFNHAFRTWSGTNPGAWRLQEMQARQAGL